MIDRGNSHVSKTPWVKLHAEDTNGCGLTTDVTLKYTTYGLVNYTTYV